MAYTSSTPMIGQAPHVRIDSLAALAAKRGGHVSLHVVIRSPPGLSGAFSVCVTPPAPVGRRICRSTHHPFGASGKFRFALTLTIKPTAPVGRMRVAISATAGTSSAKSTAVLRITA